jgi:hypothetical protein
LGCAQQQWRLHPVASLHQAECHWYLCDLEGSTGVAPALLIVAVRVIRGEEYQPKGLVVEHLQTAIETRCP